DFEKILGLVKQAECNWIWVTWSSGWSFKDEEENRENLKHVIARCHANGIHVSAYLSASNTFRKSAFRDDPETQQYGLWMHGIPLFYAGLTKTGLHISWERRLADARKPGWRTYLLKKAELAVDAGVDAIIWDNMIGYNDGLAQLLDDTQRTAEQKLSIAEAYTFGAATSRNIEGRFLSALIKREPEAQQAWSAIAQYNHFLAEHRELYHESAPAARIALLSAEPQNPLANEFLK